jgi:hypothetical protein
MFYVFQGWLPLHGNTLPVLQISAHSGPMKAGKFPKSMRTSGGYLHGDVSRHDRRDLAASCQDMLCNEGGLLDLEVRGGEQA